MDEHRRERVSEAMREELAELIGYEMTDPRVAAVDVVDVRISPDLRHAHVMLALAAEEVDQALQALDGARGYLRRELSARLELHRMPDLHFVVEPVSDPRRLGRLMKRVRKGRPKEPALPADEKKPDR
jgi:ribosome-binding factor A